MSQKSRVVLKTKFESGRTPTEEDFSDVIDSGINKLDDQVVVRQVEGDNESAKYIGLGSTDPESPLSLKNRSGRANLLGFENQGGEEKWRVEVDPDGVGEGLNITEKDKADANLFIQSGGKVGIGTKTPEEQLEIKGKVKADEFIGTVDWSKLDNVPITFLMPKGGIIMWSGTSEDVPEGWALCDGENETPNLTDRFILSAGEEYASGSMGGSHDHVLKLGEMPSHNHGGYTGYMTENTSHTHGVPTRQDDYNVSGGHGPSFGADNGDYRAYHRTDGTDINHRHSIANEGLNEPHNNMPAYYSLCLIMKM